MSSLLFPSRTIFWICWQHWFTHFIWVSHSSREMVSRPWAIKLHYLLPAHSREHLCGSQEQLLLGKITVFHPSLRAGRNVWGYNPLIQSSCLEWTLVGEVGKELAKALIFTNFLLIPSYFTWIPHNNPEVKVTAPFCRGRIRDSGRLT